MISGFMIVKDVLKQGYPFVEAIASALPVCNEFLISDGYSSDGTYEVVQRISKLNRKVKIFRQRWPVERTPTVLADVTNSLKRKCRFEFVFSVQANEIVHEESAEFIRTLPEMLPDVYTFSFPYLQLLQNYKFAQEYRLRFSRNLEGVAAIDDGWTLGPTRTFIRSEILKSLRNPRKLLRYFGKGVELAYANSGNYYFSRAVYLPKPVFRYWSLFPRNFLEKCAGHAEIFGIAEFSDIINSLKSRVDDASSFWELASQLFKKTVNGMNYPAAYAVVKESEHPMLIRGLISDSSMSSYRVRDEILELIKTL